MKIAPAIGWTLETNDYAAAILERQEEIENDN